MELTDVPRHRPFAFDKMESLIKEMQDTETGVPVRSQKLFLTYIPSAFMGYDLVEWLMERFNLDETSNVEAINLANQLCQHGYFFPVNDSKNLILKDDSSLYRFQSPYYWPWQPPRVAGSGLSGPTLGPDNVEYAIYLVKRTLRNKQRHGLEEYELEALANLKKNLSAKWDFITMQAEEQVRLAKDRKKGDKIVSDSQERAYWRVARPPPGMPNALESCPVPVRVRNPKPKKRTIQQVTREIEHLKASLDRTRVKTSIALEALVAYSETFAPYDPWITPPQPSNPWVSDDTLYWQINSPLVEVPSEKRVQRWALSIEELVSDPTGLQEFTSFLRKEYSHENIRFWLAVMDLRRSSTKQIPKKLDDIFEEFLKSGAPCEINIDGATAERVAEGIRSGSRYALDHAAEHVYNLLLKKDCYPRFIRSDHFQRLLAEGKNVHQKKAKFFNFGGQVKKKPGSTSGTPGSSALSRRRGSDRSLSGSAHELAVCAAQPPRQPEPPPHSHSQSNLCDIATFRDPLDDDTAEVLPWECTSREGPAPTGRRRQDSAADSGSSSSDVSAVNPERTRRLPQQSTLDGGLRGAPPPLRRLSAVEPRHLAPLGSPPPPRAPPTPHVAPPPHPTPTISVSSAPDDESAGSPDEPRSLAPSDEPSSVFASADVTPTEPPRVTLITAFSDPDKSVSSPIVSENVQTENFNKEVKVRAPPILHSKNSIEDTTASVTNKESKDLELVRQDDDSTVRRKTISREPSTTIETSPASNNEIITSKGDESDLGKCGGESATLETIGRPCVQANSSTNINVAIAASNPVSVAVLQSVAASTVACSPIVEPSVLVLAPISEVICTTDSIKNVPNVLGSTSVQAVVSPSIVTNSGPASKQTASSTWTTSLTTVPVAPLAVCEDIGVDDDNVEKVPSSPLQRVLGESEAGSKSGASKIAHKDELSTVSESNVVKLDDKNEIGERSSSKQRNDICPWEDESSCDCEAPFVKTYATLGYL